MKNKIMIIAVLVTVTILCLGGCDLLGLLGGTSALTAVERIEAFEEELNSSSRTASSLKSHFSESAAQYDQMDTTWWNTAFPSTNVYEFTNITSTGATLTVTASTASVGIDYTATYTMDTDADSNNLIRIFTSDFVTTIQNIQPAF